MKVRVTIWLESHQIKSIEKCVEIEDYKNNSQFVGQAVEFYLGYLNTKNSTKFISNILLGEMEGLVQTSEKRLQRQLNQNKFTTDMVLKLLEFGYELDQADMQKLADTVRREAYNC